MHLCMKIETTLWRLRWQLQHADPPTAHHVALQAPGRTGGPSVKQVSASNLDVPVRRCVTKVVDLILASEWPAMHRWHHDTTLGITRAAGVLLENLRSDIAVVGLQLSSPLVADLLKPKLLRGFALDRQRLLQKRYTASRRPGDVDVVANAIDVEARVAGAYQVVEFAAKTIQTAVPYRQLCFRG